MSDLISNLFSQVLGFLNGIQSLEGEQKPELWAICLPWLIAKTKKSGPGVGGLGNGGGAIAL